MPTSLRHTLITYFRSVCAIALSAPYTMLIQAMVPTRNAQYAMPSGVSAIPNRTTP